MSLKLCVPELTASAGSDLVVDVKLVSGAGNFHGGEPERTSATITRKSILQRVEETAVKRASLIGKFGREKVLWRKMWIIETLDSQASNIGIYSLDYSGQPKLTLHIHYPRRHGTFKNYSHLSILNFF